MVGQNQVKEVVRTLINSAKLSNEPVKHFLATSPSGYGKTSLAYITANEIGSNVFTINCGNVSKPKQVLSIIESMNDRDVLFLEECHSLPKKAQEYLYTILEDFVYHDEYGNKIAVPKITIIGATTNSGLLNPPFRSRFNFTAQFIPYTLNELTSICFLVCKEKGFTLNRDIAELITKTCRNTPRNVVARTNWVYDWMVTNKVKSVNQQKLLEIIALQGINSQGLDYNDIQYLKNLSYTPTSLNQISSKISLDKSQIQSIIEPELLKLGLIQISTKGRILTRKGIDYIKGI